MFKTALSTRTTADVSSFPMMTVRCCTSEAFDSLNGPRFCAQDDVTGALYEVQSASSTLEGPPPDEAEMATYRSRLHAFQIARGVVETQPFVALPVDASLTAIESASGEAETVISVSSLGPFCGLSLADLVRCGWGLMEESVLRDILHVAELFCYSIPLLPPHLNISADCIKRVLDVRDGLTEVRNPSRWVIGDWLLCSPTPDLTADRLTFESTISDLEWTLHSTLLELSIASTNDGSFLASTQVEQIVTDTMSRVRSFFEIELPDFDDREHVHRVLTSRLAWMVEAATVLEKDALIPDGESDSLLSYGSPALSSSLQLPEGLSLPLDLPPSADMSLKDKLMYHQAHMRSEQALLTRERRKTAPLPPMPLPRTASVSAGGNRFPGEEDEYDLLYLSSPLVPHPSAFLGTTTVEPNEESDNGKAQQQQQQRPPHDVPDEREKILQSVVQLSLIAEERVQQERRVHMEDRRVEREALRAFMARNAAMDQHSTAGVNSTGESVGATPTRTNRSARASPSRKLHTRPAESSSPSRVMQYADHQEVIRTPATTTARRGNKGSGASASKVKTTRATPATAATAAETPVPTPRRRKTTPTGDTPVAADTSPVGKPGAHGQNNVTKVLAETERPARHSGHASPTKGSAVVKRSSGAGASTTDKNTVDHAKRGARTTSASKSPSAFRPSFSPEPNPPPGSKRLVQAVPEGEPGRARQQRDVNSGAAIAQKRTRPLHRSKASRHVAAGNARGGGPRRIGAMRVYGVTNKEGPKDDAQAKTATAATAVTSTYSSQQPPVVITPLPLGRVLGAGVQTPGGSKTNTPRGSPRGIPANRSSGPNTPRDGLVDSARQSPRPATSRAIARGSGANNKPGGSNAARRAEAYKSGRLQSSTQQHRHTGATGNNLAPKRRATVPARSNTLGAGARTLSYDGEPPSHPATPTPGTPRDNNEEVNSSFVRGEVRPVHEASVGISNRIRSARRP